MPAIPDPQQDFNNGGQTYDPDCPDPQPYSAPIPAIGYSSEGGDAQPAYDPSSYSGNTAGAAIWDNSGTMTGYEHDNGSYVNAGAIAGGVIGGLAALVLAYLLYRYLKKRRSGASGMPSASGFKGSLRERLAGKKETDAEKAAAAGTGGRDVYASHVEE
ncbi:MAG: hypothetical protein Q9218_006250 [Villophora microphyllina]